MFADYHVHTEFSDDSDYKMQDCLSRAVELGLEEICFTEHTDYGVKGNAGQLPNCPTEKYLAEFERCKKIFGDKIKMKFGMEFGAQTGTVAEFQKLFDDYNFDFIILSCHQVDNLEFHVQDYQRGKTQKEYNEGYYQEIFDVMKIFNDWSILGHLDMIKRYDLQGEYPFEKVRDLIAEILKLAIKKNKGIEVNTSCYRYKLPDLTPSHDILKLYKDLGGEILTVGSDTHEESHLAYKIKHTYAELSRLGFKHIYTFDKMKPIGHNLIS